MKSNEEVQVEAYYAGAIECAPTSRCYPDECGNLRGQGWEFGVFARDPMPPEIVANGGKPYSGARNIRGPVLGVGHTPEEAWRDAFTRLGDRPGFPPDLNMKGLPPVNTPSPSLPEPPEVLKKLAERALNIARTPNTVYSDTIDALCNLFADVIVTTANTTKDEMQAQVEQAKYGQLDREEAESRIQELEKENAHLVEHVSDAGLAGILAKRILRARAFMTAVKAGENPMPSMVTCLNRINDELTGLGDSAPAELPVKADDDGIPF